MKTYITILLICFGGFSKLMAQNDFAKLEKNLNVRAGGLFHDLNKTKDTLLLKSDSKITHIYSINSNYKREIDVYLDKNTCKIPLNQLSIGKHVFVVAESPKKIIFVVRILGAPPLAFTEN